MMRSFVVAVVAILFVMGGHVADAFAPVLAPRVPAFAPASRAAVLGFESVGTTTELGMKCRSSIGSMKRRSKTCQIVRRRGRVYLIDKKNPRNKVRQGGAKMGKRKKK